MSITQVGTPTATSISNVNGANTVTNTWSGSQPRTANDILVMVCSGDATTSVTIPSAPASWTTVFNVGNTGSSPTAWVALFYLVALGADAAPSITVTTSGNTRIACTLIELTGGLTSAPLDTSGVYTSGASGITISSITVTTGAAVTAGGEYAITSFARTQPAPGPAVTWTPGTNWVNFSSDASVATRNHNFGDQLAAPPSNAVLSETAAISNATNSFAAGGIAVFAAALTLSPQLILGQAVQMAATF